ncbi:MAG: AI-2E family transporter [Nanoarchaeota archaeon]|nr:AI-2E family transporter [Nanoarchaeota archaeon]MBU0962531.1 AI-2E family transporter [Nanoarchaeota archaeon]
MVIDLLKKNSKYIWLLVVILLTYLSFLIIKPFISAIITSFILAYIFHPLHKKLSSYTKNETLTAFIITIVILLIILLPLILIAKIITTQAYSFYENGSITDVSNYIRSLTGINNIGNIISYVISYIGKIFSDFIISLPKILLNFLVILLLLFYLLKEWDSVFTRIRSLIFLKQKDKIIKHIKNVTNSIIYGYFVTAVLEGIIATILLLIFQVPHAFFFGLLTIILVVLPVVGASLIWIPVSIWLVYKGSLVLGIVFALLSLILLSGIENVLRPKVIGDKAKLHPIIMLLGIIGGMIVFGFIGIVIGPLILSIVYYIIIKDYLMGKNAA